MRARSSAAEMPSSEICSSLTNETERGVSSNDLLKPNEEPLSSFGMMRSGSAVTTISSTPSGARSCADSDSAAQRQRDGERQSSELEASRGGVDDAGVHECAPVTDRSVSRRRWLPALLHTQTNEARHPLPRVSWRARDSERAALGRATEGKWLELRGVGRFALRIQHDLGAHLRRRAVTAQPRVRRRSTRCRRWRTRR